MTEGYVRHLAILVLGLAMITLGSLGVADLLVLSRELLTLAIGCLGLVAIFFALTTEAIGLTES